MITMMRTTLESLKFEEFWSAEFTTIDYDHEQGVAFFTMSPILTLWADLTDGVTL